MRGALSGEALKRIVEADVLGVEEGHPNFDIKLLNRVLQAWNTLAYRQLGSHRQIDFAACLLLPLLHFLDAALPALGTGM